MAMTMANQRQEKAMRLGRIVTHSNIHHPSRRLATCSRVHARPLDGERRRYLCRKTRRACGVASGYGHKLRNDPLQTVRDQFIQDGKLVEETVWFDDPPVAVLKPKGASATSPVSGTGNVATNNQDANNTGTNGNTAPPAAPTARVNVEVFYVHPDHLGTPRVITASTALAATTGTGITSPQTVNKAVWRWDSDPFGSNATANSAPNENPNTLHQVVGTATLPYLFGFDLAFPGQKRDRATGKHYNYFRDYDPAVGRYVESDPIGLKGGISTFGYVKARPLSTRDPKGLSPGTVAAGSRATNTRPQYTPDCTGLSDVYCAVKYICGGLSFPLHGGSGDRSDALRHCTWSCCMAALLGGRGAQGIGDAHERDHPSGIPGDNAVDLCNNRHGRRCAGAGWMGGMGGCEICCRLAPLTNSPDERCNEKKCG